MKYLNRLAICSAIFSPFTQIYATDPELVSSSSVAHLDLAKVFQGSPIIYTILLSMSVASLVIWLYSLFTWREEGMIPPSFISSIRSLIAERRFDEALNTCEGCKHPSAKIISTGLSARKHGSQVMMEAMQSEGQRCGISLFQRLSLISDMAVIAPMLGLLGTVLGMFYAFYDSERSAESIATIFDGLGIAMGTTVAGLIVAIMAMVFYTTLKFRVIKLLNLIETEAMSLISLIDLHADSSKK
ncbi:MAG: hypothetical protein CMO81_10960 [Waddliaceae bacterium]|nr:hypothetical protein [Waddliaceae bacterium]